MSRRASTQHNDIDDHGATQFDEKDRNALLACWNAIGGASAALRQGAGDDITKWRGIKICKAHVVEVDWADEAGLIGCVPPDFGALVALNTLDRLRRERSGTSEDKEASLDSGKAGIEFSIVDYYAFTLTLVLWQPFFVIGLYSNIPWVLLFAIGFIVTALLLAAIFQWKLIINRIWVTVVVVVLVALFGALLASRSKALDIVGGVIAVVVAAFVLILLSNAIAPKKYRVCQSNRKIIYVQAVFAVAIVLVFSFLVGRYNYLFLTCNEFNTAGFTPPDNCYNITVL